MAIENYAFIKNGIVTNIAIFEEPTLELLEIFKNEWQVDYIIPATIHATVGGTWNGTEFWSQQPYPSWIKNEELHIWVAPTPRPGPGPDPENPKIWSWNEETLSWVEDSPE